MNEAICPILRHPLPTASCKFNNKFKHVVALFFKSNPVIAFREIFIQHFLNRRFYGPLSLAIFPPILNQYLGMPLGNPPFFSGVQK